MPYHEVSVAVFLGLGNLVFPESFLLPLGVGHGVQTWVCDRVS